MEIHKIAAQDRSMIEKLISPDITENLERNCFTSYVALDDNSGEINSAFVFEKIDKKSICEAEISGFGTNDISSAQKLLDYFNDIEKKEEIKQTYFEFTDPGKEITALFAQEGFKMRETEGRDLYVTLEDITKLKVLRKKTPKYIFEIGRLTSMQRWQALTNCLFFGKRGMLQDLEEIPEEWFEPDISSCVWTDDMADGVFLIHKLPSGTLMPLLLFASEPDSRINLLNMMRFSLDRAANIYSPDTKVLIRRHNSAVKLLTDKLFPSFEGKMVIRGERGKRR